MATRSTGELNRIADAWEDDLDYPSAVLSGIVGDRAHRARGGYHISIADNPRGNYSIVRKDDAAPPGNWPRDRASAVDMSMSKKDMVKCYKRVHAVWSNPKDPRRKYINAVNCWDGTGDAVRLDFVTGNASYATPDHKWHVHGERRRRYVNDPEATRAEISMYKGETVTQYQRGSAGGGTSVPVPPGSPLLRRGSSGPDVRQMQRALNEVINAGLVEDGQFGSAVEAAVKAFQHHAGLTADGIYGPATAAKLREELSMPLSKDDAHTVVRSDGAVNIPKLNADGTERSEAAIKKNPYWSLNTAVYAVYNNVARVRREVVAERAKAKAERAALRELVQQLAATTGTTLTDEQVDRIAAAVVEAGDGPAREVLARLEAAGDALAGDDES